MGAIIEVESASTEGLLCAQWIEEQWDGLPIVDTLRTLTPSHSTKSPSLPVVVAYSEGADLLGCGAILLNDMRDRPQYDPWLGCIYVRPAFRGHSIARQLVRHLVARVAQLQYPILYLFCDLHLTQFYASEGWQALEPREYEGTEVLVMKRHIP